MNKLEAILEWGGTKRDIAFLAVSAAALAVSIFDFLPFDAAWIAIILCGVPIILEAVIGLVTAFDIKADVLVSLALVASVLIGEDFAAGEVAFIMQLGARLEDLTAAKTRAGIEKLVTLKEETLQAGNDAARAIMTTDTISKEVAVEIELSGKKVTIGGMCKGSGMIHPNMCTMLGFVTTDASISKELLTKAVKADVVDSFNMISVDGDTSTNDTLLVMANGMAENDTIVSEGEDFQIFCEALHEVTTTLAKKMAGDGEGATALFETKVIHADTKEHARILAKSVICSSLTKAAIFGHDANWGRILCALGYSGVTFDPENVDLYFEGEGKRIAIFQNGVACDYSEEEASAILSCKEVTALVDMHMGEESATAWGCDLSYDYVKINADYRS